MQTRDIFNFLVEKGAAADIKMVLGNQGVSYGDSAIHFARSSREVHTIVAGLDIGTGELSLAKSLGGDLVIGHHPIGKSLSGIPDVVRQQADNVAVYGVNRNVVYDQIEAVALALERRSMEENIAGPAQVAQWLDIDLINVHTPADNLAVAKVAALIQDEQQTLGEFLDRLTLLPEVILARSFGQIPFIARGNRESTLGICSFSEFIGAEEGDPCVFLALKQAGVSTIIVMHLSETFFQAAAEAGLQIIYIGHAIGDSIGMNAAIDMLVESCGPIKVVPLGGLLRETE